MSLSGNALARENLEAMAELRYYVGRVVEAQSNVELAEQGLADASDRLTEQRHALIRNSGVLPSLRWSVTHGTREGLVVLRAGLSNVVHDFFNQVQNSTGDIFIFFRKYQVSLKNSPSQTVLILSFAGYDCEKNKDAFVADWDLTVTP